MDLAKMAAELTKSTGGFTKARLVDINKRILAALVKVRDRTTNALRGERDSLEGSCRSLADDATQLEREVASLKREREALVGVTKAAREALCQGCYGTGAVNDDGDPCQMCDGAGALPDNLYVLRDALEALDAQQPEAGTEDKEGERRRDGRN